MGEKTKISWTDHSFNPWIGCTKVSPSCSYCYAQRMANRMWGKLWGDSAPRKFFGEKHWKQPLKWDRKAEKAGVRRKVFCASMCDVFEKRSELGAWRMKLWELIEDTPNLDWLLLTKRPENIMFMIPWDEKELPKNVWLGVTAEDQERANLRVKELKRFEAVVRFVSCEPLLGKIELTPWFDFVDWVIVGSESGPRARFMDVSWVRFLAEQCKKHHVSLFYKQNLVSGKMVSLPLLDGKQYCEMPRRIIR